MTSSPHPRHESPLTSPFARGKEFSLRSSVKETLTFNPDLTEQARAISEDFSITLSLMDRVTLIKGGPRAFCVLFQGQLGCFTDRNRDAARQSPVSVTLTLKDSSMS